MKRRYLRPIKFGQRSKDFYVFDTETGKEFKNGTGRIEYFLSARPEHLVFGVIYGPKGFVKVLSTPEEFKKEFLKKRYKNKIVYAHNAEYDLSAVYGNIYHLDPNAIFNGKFISCTNGVCRFADSYNLLPTSVKKLGELIGLNKKQLGQKPNKQGVIVSNTKDLARDIDYCKTDCEIIYKSLLDLFSEAEPSFTIGSLSLKIFRAKFLTRSIKVNGLSDEFFNCLYGGRTEAFKIGGVKAHVYDLKSAYPWAMKTLRFPDPARLRYKKIEEWHHILHEEKQGEFVYEGMIEATISIPDHINIPMLPYRTEDKLLFPVGTFRGSWTLNEFRYAYFNYPVSVKAVHKLIIAESIESPFEKFIDYYFAKRAETSNEFKKYYYKLFMNNLYGKLIQRTREEWRYCRDTQDAKEYMKSRNIKRAEMIEVNEGHFLKYNVNKIFQHTIACWGSYITACIRQRLHEGIMEYPDKTVYCDTDSRAVEKEIKLNDQNLGGWSREKKTITKVRALKDYVYIDENGDEKYMLKGVPRGAEMLDMEANVFKSKRMIKTRESFRRVDNLPPGTFVDQIKVLTGDYKKRIVLKDGTTKPFKLKL